MGPCSNYGSSQDADANFGDVGSATFSAKREFCIIKVLKERCENNKKICLGLISFSKFQFQKLYFGLKIHFPKDFLLIKSLSKAF